MRNRGQRKAITGRHLLQEGELLQPKRRRSQDSSLEYRRKYSETYSRQFLVVNLHQGSINLDFRRSQSRSSDEFKRRVTLSNYEVRREFIRLKITYHLPNDLPRQPQEGLLEVVVRLRRNFEILQVFLSVESHCTSLNFSLLNV